MHGQITQIRSASKEAGSRPTLCFLPGGPGLSSAVLRSMDLLSRSFHIAYIDPPGTGGTPELTDPTLEAMISSLTELLESLRSPLILCGHSFGALYAAELSRVRHLDLRGLVFLAPAFFPKTMQAAAEAFRVEKPAELKNAELRWKKEKSNEAFKQWLGAYGPFFFLKHNEKALRQIIENDAVSANTFLKVRHNWKLDISFWEYLRSLKLPKLVITGKEDRLYHSNVIEAEAKEIGCEFIEIKNAGHFLTFDQPQAVAEVIETKWATGATEKR